MNLETHRIIDVDLYSCGYECVFLKLHRRLYVHYLIVISPSTYNEFNKII